MRERETSNKDTPVQQPTDNLLKALLKMGKNVLVNNEEKIKDMINKELSDVILFFILGSRRRASKSK